MSIKPEEVFHVVALVRAGEWTTYGDISIAVVGHRHCARFIGNLAATDDRFPHPRRVLQSGGTVADSPARSPEGVVEKLIGEGVKFRGTRADPAQRIHWDELVRRLGRRPRGDNRTYERGGIV